MTTTTITRSKTRRGFTLAEVIVGSAIGAFILAGMLSTFLMLGRSGTNIVSYSTMDAQTRRALEEFAQDVRMASNITWNGDLSITLTVPDNYPANANLVTYAWDTTAGSATYHHFFRKPGNDAATTTRTSFIRNVTSLRFLRYDRLNATATTDAGTKRIQINMTITTENRTVVAATDTTLSASFVLRNKTTN
ncbi:MAG: prepilin-type N-terminal cleavage/methylation domain-containing protein [Verrucomicrobia bacterium]|nr:prepilin-type N-terminal cleavage/methylation domain-containing protein [Verrucomicrobiota bacterium]